MPRPYADDDTFTLPKELHPFGDDIPTEIPPDMPSLEELEEAGEAMSEDDQASDMEMDNLRRAHRRAAQKIIINLAPAAGGPAAAADEEDEDEDEEDEEDEDGDPFAPDLEPSSKYGDEDEEEEEEEEDELGEHGPPGLNAAIIDALGEMLELHEGVGLQGLFALAAQHDVREVEDDGPVVAGYTPSGLRMAVGRFDRPMTGAERAAARTTLYQHAALRHAETEARKRVAKVKLPRTAANAPYVGTLVFRDDALGELVVERGRFDARTAAAYVQAYGIAGPAATVRDGYALVCPAALERCLDFNAR